MPLHVSILRSFSGSTDCSLLKLHVKNYEYTVMFICDVAASCVCVRVVSGAGRYVDWLASWYVIISEFKKFTVEQ